MKELGEVEFDVTVIVSFSPVFMVIDEFGKIERWPTGSIRQISIHNIIPLIIGQTKAIFNDFVYLHSIIDVITDHNHITESALEQIVIIAMYSLSVYLLDGIL